MARNIHIVQYTVIIQRYFHNVELNIEDESELIREVQVIRPVLFINYGVAVTSLFTVVLYN
ncbi:hypothetical protein J6590_103501 [Homalodisca vitripennis]|nr:hypothetical protein J6590_103501 [Homalodisca vitripennis]